MSDAPISSRARDRIPPPARLRRLLRSLAMLDAILEPDSWEHRYYSYDPSWAPDEAMASMRDGQGDWFAVLFPASGGAVLRGFGHESVMSPFRGRDGSPWPGLFDGLPRRYSWARDADGFVADEITFCLWHQRGWQIGAVELPAGVEDPDGSEGLLALLDGAPSSYVEWARQYYDRQLDLAAVGAIYASTPLGAELVAALSPGTTMRAAARAAKEVGYPMAKVEKKTASKMAATKATKKEAAPKKKAGKKRPISTKRRERVARMKEVFGFGEASFAVELKVRTVRMMVNGKALAAVETTDEKLYDKIFDLVKSTISNAKM